MCQDGMDVNVAFDSILEHADALMEYAESGCIDDVSDLSSLLTLSSETIYRGLYLPKEWLSPGRVIDEWNGSSHWTRSFDVAKRFSTSMDGEDFMLEYGEEHGLDDLSEVLPLFKPVVLVMDEPVRSIDLGRYLDVLEQNGYDVGSIFLSGKNDEQEISVVGYHFKIEEIQYNEGQCCVCVAPVKIEKNLSVLVNDSEKQSVDEVLKTATERSAESGRDAVGKEVFCKE